MKTLCVMTFNLRTAAAEAADKPRGNDWCRRRPLCQQLLADLKPDVVGLQEAPVEPVGRGHGGGQTSEVLAALPGYRLSQHEELALLWNPQRVEAVDGGSVTLGEFGNPDPWGHRWVQWQKFLVGDSGAPFVVLNTHLSVEADHEPQARQVFYLAQLQGGCFPTLVMGDFNFDATGLFGPYGFADGVTDHGGTFHDFAGGRDNPRLDFLAVKNLVVDRSGVETRCERQGPWEVYPSDHYPVWAELLLPAPLEPELGRSAVLPPRQ